MRESAARAEVSTPVSRPVIPVRDADPRAKILATLVLVLGIVLLAPLSALELAALAGLLLAAGFIAEAPALPVLLRSLAVLPVAGAMALFSPVGSGWGPAEVSHATSLVATAWLCTWTTLLLAALTPAPELLGALSRLGAPAALVTLLSFLLRYVHTLRAQVRSMHRALVSRAPGLSPRREVLLYGNLAGALLLRAHDRGERVHAAMLARGFRGTLPLAPPTRRVSLADLAVVGLPLLALLALGLARL